MDMIKKMLKWNLQLFAEPVQGKKMIYLFRIHENATTETGRTIALTTENSRSTSKDADSTATKDGSIRTPGVAESEVSATAILAKGDAMITKLEEAMYNDKLFDIWEANLEEAGATEGTFKGRYWQGYLTSFEKGSPSDDFTEVSLTFGLNGDGVAGDVTVTIDEQEQALYSFIDTTIVSGENTENTENTGA